MSRAYNARRLVSELRPPRRLLHLLCINTLKLSAVFPFIALLHFVAAWRVLHPAILMIRASILALSLICLCLVRVAHSGWILFTVFSFVVAAFRTFGEALIYSSLKVPQNVIFSGTVRDYWFISLLWIYTGLPLWSLSAICALMVVGCIGEYVHQCLSDSPAETGELLLLPVYVCGGLLMYFTVVCVAACICRTRNRPMRVLLDLPIAFFKEQEANGLQCLLPSTLEKKGFTREEHLAVMLRLTETPIHRVLALLALSEKVILGRADSARLTPIEEFERRALLRKRRVFLGAMLQWYLMHVSSEHLRGIAKIMRYRTKSETRLAELTLEALLQRPQESFWQIIRRRALVMKGLFTCCCRKRKTKRLRQREDSKDDSSTIPKTKRSSSDAGRLTIPEDLVAEIPNYMALRRAIAQAIPSTDPLLTIPRGILANPTDSDLVERLAALPTFTPFHCDKRRLSKKSVKLAEDGKNREEEFFVVEEEEDALSEFITDILPDANLTINCDRETHSVNKRNLRLSITQTVYRRYGEAVALLAPQQENDTEHGRWVRGLLRPKMKGPPPPSYWQAHKSSVVLSKFGLARFMRFLRAVHVALESATWQATVLSPHRTPIGTFTDQKSERWYIAWSSVVRARIHVMLARPVFHFGIVYSVMLCVSFIADYWQCKKHSIPMTSVPLMKILLWNGLRGAAYLTVLFFYGMAQVRRELRGPLTTHIFQRRALCLAGISTLLCCSDLIVHNYIFTEKFVNFHIVLSGTIPLPAVLLLGRRMSVVLAAIMGIFMFVVCLTLEAPLKGFGGAFLEAALMVPGIAGLVFGLGSALDENFRFLFSRFVLPYLLYTDSLSSLNDDEAFIRVEHALADELAAKKRHVRFGNNGNKRWLPPRKCPSIDRTPTTTAPSARTPTSPFVRISSRLSSSRPPSPAKLSDDDDSKVKDGDKDIRETRSPSRDSVMAELPPQIESDFARQDELGSESSQFRSADYNETEFLDA